MSFLFCFPLHTYLVFVWFSLLSLFVWFSLIAEFQLELYGIFSPCSWHLAKLSPNIFILSQSDQHSLSVLLQIQKYSCYHVVSSNVKPCNGFEFPHSSPQPATIASHFVHSSLVDELYAKEVYFCNFVTKCNNPVQHAPNIHPNVFNSFHKTVILGESYGVFTSPSPSNDFSIHFTMKPLPSVTYPFFLYQNPQIVFSPLGKRSRTAPDLNCCLLFIRPLVYVQIN